MSDQSGQNRAAAEKAPLWKRLLPILGGLAIVVFVFGWVLPQFIDYESAFRAIGKIDAFEWIVLIIVAVIRFIPEGWLFVAAQPALNTKQGPGHRLRRQAHVGCGPVLERSGPGQPGSRPRPGRKSAAGPVRSGRPHAFRDNHRHRRAVREPSGLVLVGATIRSLRLGSTLCHSRRLVRRLKRRGFLKASHSSGPTQPMATAQQPQSGYRYSCARVATSPAANRPARLVSVARANWRTLLLPAQR